MISWMIRLCALCSMSALLQMIASTQSARDALRMICGLLMLRMTMQSAQMLLNGFQIGGSLNELFELLIK